MFRTILTEFIIESFVEAFILLVTINTPVTFGIMVVTIIGEEIEPFFSKTTVVVVSEMELPSFVSVFSVDSVRYVTVGVESTITKTETDEILSNLSIKFVSLVSTSLAKSDTETVVSDFVVLLLVFFKSEKVEITRATIIIKHITQLMNNFLFFL